MDDSGGEESTERGSPSTNGTGSTAPAQAGRPKIEAGANRIAPIHQPTPVECAATYEPADDLFIITSFFNPADFKAKLRNFQFFAAKLAGSNLNWLAVECAFGEQPFVLPASPNVVRVRTSGVMWQKERLLNLALEHVPSRFRKIAWLDGDLLFQNADWAVETAALLESYPVVQCFSAYARLPRGHHAYFGEGEAGESFAAVHRPSTNGQASGRYDLHGHTGFAWAARRELLDEHGLYDACVAGGGDHLIAHAFHGDVDTRCLDGLFACTDSAHRFHALEWGRRIHGDVRGRIGCVEGTVLHLWHGDRQHRRYLERQYDLVRAGFDPRTDLVLNHTGCWEWSRANSGAQRFLERYFPARLEDG